MPCDAQTGRTACGTKRYDVAICFGLTYWFSYHVEMQCTSITVISYCDKSLLMAYCHCIWFRDVNLHNCSGILPCVYDDVKEVVVFANHVCTFSHLKLEIIGYKTYTLHWYMTTTKHNSNIGEWKNVGQLWEIFISTITYDYGWIEQFLVVFSI